MTENVKSGFGCLSFMSADMRNVRMGRKAGESSLETKDVTGKGEGQTVGSERGRDCEKTARSEAAGRGETSKAGTYI